MDRFARFLLLLALLAPAAPEAVARQRDATAKLAPTPPSGSAGLFVGVSHPADVPPAAAGATWAPDDAVLLAHTFVVEYGLIPPANCVVAIDRIPQSPASVKRMNALRTSGVQFLGTSRNELLQALSNVAGAASRWGAADRRPTVCVFAAFGYGTTENGLPYFAASDSTLRRLGLEGISVPQVRAQMALSSAAHRLTFWDASLDRSTPQMVSPAIDVPGAVAIDAQRRQVLQSGGNEAFITGFDSGESSFEIESTTGGIGLTAWSFAAALGQAETDVDRDGVLTLAETAARANLNVAALLRAERQKLPGTPALKQTIRCTAGPATLRLPLARTSASIGGIGFGARRPSPPVIVGPGGTVVPGFSIAPLPPDPDDVASDLVGRLTRRIGLFGYTRQLHLQLAAVLVDGRAPVDLRRLADRFATQPDRFFVPAMTAELAQLSGTGAVGGMNSGSGDVPLVSNAGAVGPAVAPPPKFTDREIEAAISALDAADKSRDAAARERALVKIATIVAEQPSAFAAGRRKTVLREYTTMRQEVRTKVVNYMAEVPDGAGGERTEARTQEVQYTVAVPVTKVTEAEIYDPTAMPASIQRALGGRSASLGSLSAKMRTAGIQSESPEALDRVLRLLTVAENVARRSLRPNAAEVAQALLPSSGAPAAPADEPSDGGA
ncbi:hypothetical protein [Alienimonas chondri]|uniref:Caspase domain-containing protein n=1 Tax=Alienimonas chondri TaxID=2681879 RepID=A0ABX1VDI0_9PLAN|nr:hypothetical protein [Alienimonas chondri]NNJ25292.1 hypothetical protein [Alienimonas chondri]